MKLFRIIGVWCRGFLCTTIIFHFSACGENGQKEKAMIARVEANPQDGRKARPKTQEPDVQPDVETEGKPEAFPAGGMGPRPVGWDVSVVAAAISPSGKYVILGYKGGQAFNVCFRVWDTEKAKLFAALKGHEDAEIFYPVFCSFLGDDRRVISVGCEGKAIIHTLKVTGNRSVAQMVETFWVHEFGALTCALSENGRYLVTLGMDPGIEHYLTKIWDLDKRKLLQILDDQILADFDAGVAISPDGKFALTYGQGLGLCPLIFEISVNLIGR